MDLTYEFAAAYQHRIVFRSNLLTRANAEFWNQLLPAEGDRQPRAQLILDDGLHAARPQIAHEIQTAMPLDWTGDPQVIPGGEVGKNQPDELERLLQQLETARLCRRSYVVVAGGGAALDLVGLAAALTHRGVRLVRLPTTTLAQCDSGVGVKNGVNRFGKKNFLGTFAAPWAVLNDPLWLTSLRDYDWRSGFSEVIKVALLKDARLFETVEQQADAIRGRDLDAAGPVLARSAELHAEHIALGGDPFEDQIARPLDFGHWAAHKLEALSNFDLAHGHAVAIGLAIDVHYSALSGRITDELAERICRCLERLGFALGHPLLDNSEPLLDGLEEFREHLGGPLTITLLTDLGTGVDATEIDSETMRAAIARVAALEPSACP